MFTCTQRTSQKKYFELILTLKVETTNPVGGPFSCEFSAFVIIAELSQVVIFKSNFFAFLEKRPLMVKFLKFCLNVFTT